MRNENKRLHRGGLGMKSFREHYGDDPQDDYNEPFDAKFAIDVATSDDVPCILFDGDKKYSAYIYFKARGWVHVDSNDDIEIGRHKIYIYDMAIGKYDSEKVEDGTWLGDLDTIDEKVIDDNLLNGLKTEDGRTLKQACEDMMAEAINYNYEDGTYDIEYAEEDGETYIDFQFYTVLGGDESF